eukprot:2947492-Pyramimonas_sp.AAC.1
MRSGGRGLFAGGDLAGLFGSTSDALFPSPGGPHKLQTLLVKGASCAFQAAAVENWLRNWRRWAPDMEQYISSQPVRCPVVL